MTTDITTPDTATETPATELSALQVLKLHVVDQLTKMCVVEGICDTAVARLWSRDSGVDMSGVTRPRMTSFVFEVPLTGTKRFEYAGYTRAAVASLAQREIDGLVRDGYIYSTRVDNVAFGPILVDQDEVQPLPAMLPDDDETRAFKAALRRFAQDQVDGGSIYRKQVNPYLRALGVEELAGPKDWTFTVRVVGLPGVVAEYVIKDERTEEAARAAFTALRASEGDMIPTKRLRIPASMMAGTAELAGSVDQ